jgi:DHA2 family multidrug resistance protein
LVEVRALTIAGASIVAISAFFDLPITSEWQVRELWVGQLLQGIGLPLMALPLVYMFLGEVRPPAESLPAASILNLSRVLSGTIAGAWLTTALRLRSQSNFSEILTNTGLYPSGRGTSLATLAAHTAHFTSDPLLARSQAVQIVARAARRQAAALGVSDTLSTLGWLLFASCILVIMMAEFGHGRSLSNRDTPT